MNTKELAYIIIITGILLAFVVGIYREVTHKPLLLEDLSYVKDIDESMFAFTNLTDLKYKIEIDCLWLSEHLDDNQVLKFWFSDEVIELCKSVFPELNYTLNPRR